MTDLTEPPAVDLKRLPVASLWRRLAAFFLDGLVLAAIGYAIVGCLIAGGLYDWLVRIGDAGRLIGLVVAVAYFGVSDSRATGGRSLGKRVLKIKVIGSTGQPLSVPAAAVRSSILMTPFLLNGVNVGLSVTLGALVSLALFGLGAALLYLFLFNRRTRQSLHDLAVGSLVVPQDNKVVERSSMWPVHWLPVAGLLAATAVLPLIPPSALMNSIADAVAIRQSIMSLPNVRAAGVVDLTVAMAMLRGEREHTHYVKAIVHLRQRPDDLDAAARHIAEVVLREDGGVLGTRPLVVAVDYGFNVGIAGGHRGTTFQTSASAWPNPVPGFLP